MQVKLISLTAPSQAEHRGLTAEQLIVYIARVSNPSNQHNHETASRLIRYMIDHKHWSPFEMVDMTVEIVTSRAIAQQILRHRSFSFQEFSQRYALVTEMEPIQLRIQADRNRQSSTEAFTGEQAQALQEVCGNAAQVANDAYAALINAGVAKECARMVLPLTTQTRIYMKGSVRSWIHYLQIRCDEHVQLEHREIAVAIKGIFCAHFPDTAQALGWS